MLPRGFPKWLHQLTLPPEACECLSKLSLLTLGLFRHFHFVSLPFIFIPGEGEMVLHFGFNFHHLDD